MNQPLKELVLAMYKTKTDASPSNPVDFLFPSSLRPPIKTEETISEHENSAAVLTRQFGWAPGQVPILVRRKDEALSL